MNAGPASFAEVRAEACGAIRASTDRECLRSRFDYYTGVLRGYYFAGAVSRVELVAALAQLRTVHTERLDATAPAVPFRAQGTSGHV